MKTLILDLTKPIADITLTEDCRIIAAWTGSGDESIDRQFSIVHSQPGIKSEIVIKALLKDKSSLKLKPKIVINRGAKATDSSLKVSVLMLSDQAKAQVIPALEISEKEVIAGHGVTIGKLDQEQLIYLQTRGLSQKQAEELLSNAFIQDIISEIALNTKSNE